MGVPGLLCQRRLKPVPLLHHHAHQVVGLQFEPRFVELTVHEAPPRRPGHFAHPQEIQERVAAPVGLEALADSSLVVYRGLDAPARQYWVGSPRPTQGKYQYEGGRRCPAGKSNSDGLHSQLCYMNNTESSS
jgi:hypothetical protein